MPPAEIAAQLARISRNEYPHRHDDTSSSPQAVDPLAPIFDAIQQRTGVDFAQYKIGTVQRRILRRMALSNIDALPDYIQRLRGDTAEVDTLYGDLLISVTSFFRQPDLFTFLSECVFPDMLKRREPSGAIRVWVPGCATGQEAYSVAIVLIESLGHAPSATPIQVFGSQQIGHHACPRRAVSPQHRGRRIPRAPAAFLRKRGARVSRRQVDP